jgi:hypothetical protein
MTCIQLRQASDVSNTVMPVEISTQSPFVIQTTTSNAGNISPAEDLTPIVIYFPWRSEI